MSHFACSLVILPNKQHPKEKACVSRKVYLRVDGRVDNNDNNNNNQIRSTQLRIFGRVDFACVCELARTRLRVATVCAKQQVKERSTLASAARIPVSGSIHSHHAALVYCGVSAAHGLSLI